MARQVTKKKKKGIDWESFGKEMVGKVLDALEYWCLHASGDSALDCYSAHLDRGLYELAEEFVGLKSWGSQITEEDLELLKKMPEKYYKKFDDLLYRKIEEIVRELEREEREY